MKETLDIICIKRADYQRLLEAAYRDINHSLERAFYDEQISTGKAEMHRKEAKKNADMLRRLVPDWPAPEWWP